MDNEITDTLKMAEAEYDGHSEPDDVHSDIVATKEPEGRGIWMRRSSPTLRRPPAP